jgi:hypothetical protein
MSGVPDGERHHRAEAGVDLSVMGTAAQVVMEAEAAEGMVGVVELQWRLGRYVLCQRIAVHRESGADVVSA